MTVRPVKLVRNRVVRRGEADQMAKIPWNSLAAGQTSGASSFPYLVSISLGISSCLQRLLSQ